MILTTKEQFKKLRQGGKLLGRILRQVAAAAVAGVTTKQLDDLAVRLIKEAGGQPSFLGYGQPPFPGALCASLNHVVVHGLPDPNQVLKDGDIIGLDLGMRYEGFYTDTALTVAIGNPAPLAVKLLKTTAAALLAGLEQVKPGKKTGDVGQAVQQTAEEAGFSVVRDLVGHGVGGAVHEEPAVPNFGSAGHGSKFKEGQVIAVEPMVNAGQWQVETSKNGWEVLTVDRQLSAHFEHTVVATAKYTSPVVITEPTDQPYDDGKWW